MKLLSRESRSVAGLNEFDSRISSSLNDDDRFRKLFSPRHILQANLTDRDTIELAKRIEVVESEEMNRAHRLDSYPCRVEVILPNEQCLDSGLVRYEHSSTGETETEFGDYTRHADVVAKFKHITEPVIGRSAAGDLLELVENMDSLEDLSPFIALWS